MISEFVQSVGAAIALAEATHLAASVARQDMELLLERSLCAYIYPGLVIDLREYRTLPECFINVKTMRGNDRGTKVFRFESFASVDANTTHPSLSHWIANAVPISEKTGADMSAKSHGAGSRDTVGLRAQIVCERMSDLTGDAAHQAEHEHLLAFVATAETAVAARAAAPSLQAQPSTLARKAKP